MPRPDPRAPGEGQGDLLADDGNRPFTVNTAAQQHRHRISTEIDEAFKAAQEKDLLHDEHRALVAVVRHAGWAMDNFEATNKPYGAAKLIPGVTEALRELGLTPASQAEATEASIETLVALMGGQQSYDAR